MNVPSARNRLLMKTTLAFMIMLLVSLVYMSPPLVRASAAFVFGAFLLVGLRLWFVNELCVWQSQKAVIFTEAPQGVPPARRSIGLVQERARSFGGDQTPRKVCFLTGSSGGGHAASVRAVRAVLKELSYNWDIVEVDMSALLENSQRITIKELFGCTGEDVYNWCLCEGTIWSSLFARFILLITRAIFFVLHNVANNVGVRVVADEWRRQQPDLVVSFITLTNRLIIDSLAYAGLPTVPLVTVVTDFEHSVYHPWMQSPRQNLVCGTDALIRQAHAMGFAKSRVFPTTGMVINPRFYDIRNVDRDAELRKLHLNPAHPTVLIFYGGFGSKKMEAIAWAVTRTGRAVNLIFICGRNAELQERLRVVRWPVPVLVEGFTDRVAFYMHLSEIIICKPG
jgi:UDP-N-acetylglucosamine:LPS N-acetylglucosamine transferase